MVSNTARKHGGPSLHLVFTLNNQQVIRLISRKYLYSKQKNDMVKMQSIFTRFVFQYKTQQNKQWADSCTKLLNIPKPCPFHFRTTRKTSLHNANYSLYLPS